MLARSLSRITARTIGRGATPASSTYDASASAPAGLCAASISSSPPVDRSHSSRAGHRASLSPVRTASLPTGRPSLIHHLEHAHGRGGIGHLMPPRQRQPHGRVDARRARDTARSPLRCVMSTSPSTCGGLHQRRPGLGGGPGDDGAGLVGQLADHQRHVAPGDAGLLGRDRRQRRAEVTFVVEGDRGDRRAHGRDHRGRIEAAARGPLRSPRPPPGRGGTPRTPPPW